MEEKKIIYLWELGKLCGGKVLIALSEDRSVLLDIFSEPAAAPDGLRRVFQTQILKKEGEDDHRPIILQVAECPLSGVLGKTSQREGVKGVVCLDYSDPGCVKLAVMKSG